MVGAASLHVLNLIMEECLHSGQWLGAAEFSELTFESKSLADVKTADQTTTAKLSGTLTLHGVAKELVVPVKLTYLKDKLGARTGGQMNGDLLVIRADFRILRSDFGINPQAPEDKVANEIDLAVSLAGAAPR